MLRTVARSNILRETLKKSVRANVIRSASVECSKRKHFSGKTSLLNQPQAQKWQFQILRHYADLPPHIKVNLPALSPTMEAGTILSWEKKEGDKLNEGDLLAEIETDKATMGFETPEEGYLAKILIAAGTKNVPVGKLVCIIVTNEEDIAKFKDFKDDSQAAAAPPPPKPAASAPAPSAPAPSTPPPSAPAVAPPPPPAADAGVRVYVSPMAKQLAARRQIRLQGKGTGLFDSITSKDLDKLAGAPVEAAKAPAVSTPPPPGASYVDVPLTNMRTVIAKRLTESKQTIPHYYLTMDINMDKILELRNKTNKKLEKQGVKLSVNDFLIKAIAMAAKKVPQANTYWMGTAIREFRNVDVSVAVSTPGGLVTPIIFSAHEKGVVQISKEMKDLASRARANKLKPTEYQGGTITLSNLGMYGISHFSAIINPPQSILVATGKVEPKLIPADTEKGFAKANFMSATASIDHRTVDGALGAEYMRVLRECLEDPAMMIV